ncbi:hypothetical protein [Rhodococcus sp. NPDC047139]|uniref:hypothetical protein n=1 Tax=Rhodococcus sp. NPDC047139 TaxID=3155141 RepID=UPI0033D4AC34
MGEVAEFSVGGEDATRAERIEALRRRIASVPARGELSAVARGRVETTADRILPVPDPLAELFPHGGLVRGSIVAVSGATSLLLGMLASVTASGGYAAVIGQRRLGLLAAAEMGARLHRLAVIPDPGPDPVEIAAVLLDGIDLVVLGLGGASVPPSRTRAVAARVRSKQSVLVVTDGRWEGAQVRLEARVDGYRGVDGPDRGRLCATRLSVRAHGRAFSPRAMRVEVCADRSAVEWTSGDRNRLEDGRFRKAAR